MAAGPLIHIGFHKTASTFLQRSLFDVPGSPLVTPAGVDRRTVVHNIVLPDALSYDADTVRSRYDFHLRRARGRDETLVLSHERLSGYPSSGGHDRARIAARLRETFPDGRVLMIIREQRSLIGSMYRQHITDGGVGGVQRFLETADPGLGRKPSFSLALYEFDRLIALYQELFGRDRVLVLPMEWLRADPTGFAARICAFCGHDSPVLPEADAANVARPLLMQVAQRPLNFLFYHNELSPGSVFHIPNFHKRYARLQAPARALAPAWLERRLAQRLANAIGRTVGDHYAASNARTEALIEQPLAHFGYDVAQAANGEVSGKPECVPTAEIHVG